jgi:penicillin amidase
LKKCIVCLLLFLAAGCGQSQEKIVSNKGLLDGSRVTVYRDSMGIAHIYAATDEDLFFGYGYQVAKDRLYQLDMFRRRAHGRLCEVLGPDYIIEDRQARIFNWAHWGRLDAQKMQTEIPERWALIKAWVAGVNQRIAEVAAGDVPRPFGLGSEEFNYVPEALENEDPIIVQKMVQFGLDLSLEFEVFNTFGWRLFPDIMAAVELFKPISASYTVPEAQRNNLTSAAYTPQTAPPICTEGAALPNLDTLKAFRKMKGLGSNNWAVHGRHTANGRPMLAGDPHIGFGFSGTLYGIHLNSKDAGGSFNVAGFSFVGAPGIAMGQNEHIIWSPTSSFPDVMDMWEVVLGDGTVDIAGQKVPTVSRSETIQIKGQESNTINVVDVPGYGVIIPPAQLGSPIPIAVPGREVLMGWTGFKARSSNYFLELNRAKSIEEFDAAVLRLPEMSYNFVAADKTGITYRVGVEVPLRNPIVPGREPWRTMDGDDPLAFWQTGQLTAEQLPHSRAPERGWLATANNDPWGFTADGHADNDPFYYGAFFAPGWRARRIEQQLSELTQRGEVTIEEMQALQMDVHSNLADDLLPLLQTAWQESGGAGEAEALYQLLMDWDRAMTRDSAAALAFHVYAHVLAREVLIDDISVLFTIVMEVQPIYMLKVATLALSGAYSNGDKVLQGGAAAIQIKALQDTALYLTERFGSQNSGFKYSDTRLTDLNGAFGLGIDLGMVATDGGESTVNVAAGIFFDGAEPATTWPADWGPMVRVVGQFNDNGPEVFVNFPLGNIADRDSPHFKDGLNDWVNGNYKRLLFETDDILKSAAVESSM